MAPRAFLRVHAAIFAAAPAASCERDRDGQAKKRKEIPGPKERLGRGVNMVRGNE